jgi:hypothetical protein
MCRETDEVAPGSSAQPRREVPVDVEEDFTRLSPTGIVVDGTIAAWSATSGIVEATHTKTPQPKCPD